MYTPRNRPIPSALGAVLAATLLTIVTVAPDAVRAQDNDTAQCPAKIIVVHQPILQ